MNAFTGEANTRDNAVAREYFRRSADQGYAPAQVVLGFLYDTATTVPASPHDAASAEGRGVAQDRFQAYVWFLVALDAGYPASSDLSYLNPFLSPDQIDQAKAKARHLEDSVTRSAAAHGCTGWSGEFGDIPTPPPPQKQRFCR